jgi:hypothetical protein
MKLAMGIVLLALGVGCADSRAESSGPEDNSNNNHGGGTGGTGGGQAPDASMGGSAATTSMPAVDARVPEEELSEACLEERGRCGAYNQPCCLSPECGGDDGCDEHNLCCVGTCSADCYVWMQLANQCTPSCPLQIGSGECFGRWPEQACEASDEDGGASPCQWALAYVNHSCRDGGGASCQWYSPDVDIDTSCAVPSEP